MTQSQWKVSSNKEKKITPANRQKHFLTKWWLHLYSLSPDKSSAPCSTKGQSCLQIESPPTSLEVRRMHRRWMSPVSAKCVTLIGEASNNQCPCRCWSVRTEKPGYSCLRVRGKYCYPGFWLLHPIRAGASNVSNFLQHKEKNETAVACCGAQRC